MRWKVLNSGTSCHVREEDQPPPSEGGEWGFVRKCERSFERKAQEVDWSDGWERMNVCTGIRDARDIWRRANKVRLYAFLTIRKFSSFAGSIVTYM
ncbi:hypothetical protein CDAR_100291 [Caerostris darwini]|uniref:Uncharacterized protein n=1 Tax=Caerostris darwini TaxID=1538125 RepID=A0AAV4NK40_9ARAC|nr:hypothetical protein CDAR_100291 [Caerostris darwini]